MSSFFDPKNPASSLTYISDKFLDHGEEGDQSAAPCRSRHKIRHSADTQGQHDVTKTAVQSIKYDTGDLINF